MSDLIQQIVAQISAKLVSQRDNIVLDALKQRLGNFELESLRGRLTHVTYQHDRREEYLLDGELVCELYPVEYEIRDNHYCASQKYRLIPQVSA